MVLELAEVTSHRAVADLKCKDKRREVDRAFKTEQPQHPLCGVTQPACTEGVCVERPRPVVAVWVGRLLYGALARSGLSLPLGSAQGPSACGHQGLKGLKL